MNSTGQSFEPYIILKLYHISLCMYVSSITEPTGRFKCFVKSEWPSGRAESNINMISYAVRNVSHQELFCISCSDSLFHCSVNIKSKYQRFKKEHIKHQRPHPVANKWPPDSYHLTLNVSNIYLKVHSVDWLIYRHQPLSLSMAMVKTAWFPLHIVTI